MDKINTYVADIDNNVYHADKDYISSSQLKKAYHSPGTFNWYMNQPYEKPAWKEGNAMDFGSLVHTMLLEPHLTDKEFAFMDTNGRNWRTKVDRTFKTQFLDANEDKIVLSIADKHRAERCREAALAHDFLRKLLEDDGAPELSGYFKNDFYNMQQRIRPDRKLYNLDGAPALLDLKTIDNIENFKKKALWEFHYDLSAQMYLEGNEKITGEKDVPFYFGVVESQAPYRVAVYKAGEQFLAKGKEKYYRSMENVQVARGLHTDRELFQECKFELI